MLSKILINSSIKLNQSLRSINQFRLLCLTSSNKQSNKQTEHNQTTSSKESTDEDNYVRYSKSKASSFKASENFRPSSNQGPPSQWYFVTFSVVIFLIYFTMLREENDIDEKLYTPWSGNEEIYKQILQVHLNQTTDNVKINEIKNRIKELEEKINKD